MRVEEKSSMVNPLWVLQAFDQPWTENIWKKATASVPSMYFSCHCYLNNAGQLFT